MSRAFYRVARAVTERAEEVSAPREDGAVVEQRHRVSAGGGDLHDVAQPGNLSRIDFFQAGAVTQLAGVVPAPRTNAPVPEQGIAGLVCGRHLANVAQRTGGRRRDRRTPVCGAKFAVDVGAPGVPVG